MQQNTKEWLEMRKNHIGASDAPVIMEVSTFKRSDGRKLTPYVLWMEKLDLLPPTKENLAMRWGKENEDRARQVYSQMIGEEFTQEVIFHEEISYMMASLDGINYKKDMIVEIKNAGEKDHELAKEGLVPIHYIPQLQHQLECCGLDYMHYFSFHKDEGVIVEVKKDEEYLEKLKQKESEFWNHLYNFTPPSIGIYDHVEKDERWYEEAKKLFDIQEQRKKLEKLEADQEEMLKSLSSGESCIYKDLRYTASFRKGSIDYTKIPEISNVDLEKYRKKSSVSWRLRPIKED